MDFNRAVSLVVAWAISIVALFSAGCTIASMALAYPTGPKQFIARIPAEGWAVFTFGVSLGTFASIKLVELLSSGNPGLTMVLLNAGTNVLTYVMGAIFYGTLTWRGTGSVLLIASGVALSAITI